MQVNGPWTRQPREKTGNVLINFMAKGYHDNLLASVSFYLSCIDVIIMNKMTVERDSRISEK